MGQVRAMDPAEAAALLHRASRSEQDIAGTLTVHHAPGMPQRLARRSLDRAPTRGGIPARAPRRGVI